MGQRQPAKRLFHTICEEIVYFKTFILSVILVPQFYPLLTVTFSFKEIYTVHLCSKTNIVRSDSKSGATKGNVASN